MNELKAVVTNIDNLDNLNIVEFDYKGISLSMMSLDLSEVQIGTEVILTVKASNVAIAKNLEGLISLSNEVEGEITKLDMGKLLCSLQITSGEDKISSIITTKSANRMNLKLEDKVSALIKASAISIKKVVKC